jgi:hypothetical protein
MKAISGSIIVMSGAIVFAAGSLSRGDAQTAAWIFGGMLVFFGLYGWFLACVRDSK